MFSNEMEMEKMAKERKKEKRKVQQQSVTVCPARWGRKWKQQHVQMDARAVGRAEVHPTLEKAQTAVEEREQGPNSLPLSWHTCSENKRRQRGEETHTRRDRETRQTDRHREMQMRAGWPYLGAAPTKTRAPVLGR